MAKQSDELSLRLYREHANRPGTLTISEKDRQEMHAYFAKRGFNPDDPDAEDIEDQIIKARAQAACEA